MKLQKLLDQQAALAKQIDAVRKAEAQANKAASVALMQVRKAAVLRAAEKAGLLNIAPDLLAVEFQKIANTLALKPTENVTESATPTLTNYITGT